MEEISWNIAWHGRLMVLAWAVLVPAGILIARFFKVMPSQRWPEEVDNQTWWYSHQLLQYSACIITALAVGLILTAPVDLFRYGLIHKIVGWVTVVSCTLQLLSGWFRGNKGGPTDRRADGSTFGHHYNMTPRRRLFETVHKTNGYIALTASSVAIQAGLLAAKAPYWMAIVVALWWIVLIVLFIYLQRSGFRVDTYQAIWGHAFERNPGPDSQDFD